MTRARAAELAERDRLYQVLRLAGTAKGRQEFAENYGLRPPSVVTATADCVPILLSIEGPLGESLNPAVLVPARFVEQEGGETCQRLAMPSNGKFHGSVMLALHWATERFGPPPTGLAICVDGGNEVPLPQRGKPSLSDESAGLAVLVAATWYLRGIQPSKPVAFTGELDEKSRWVRGVNEEDVKDKARAAKRARVTWTVTPVARSLTTPSVDRRLALIRLEEAPWLEWIQRAEEELQGCGVLFQPAIGVWEEWLRRLEGLRAERRLAEAIKVVERLVKLARSVPGSSDPRWREIFFRLQWEVATLALHRGDPQKGGQVLEELAKFVKQTRWRLPSVDAARLSATRLQAYIDQGLRRPPSEIIRHLERIVKLSHVDSEAKVYALGALAEWTLYDWCWRRRGGAEVLRVAESLLRKKRRLEETGGPGPAPRLHRSNGQLATMLSLAGRWEEVPPALSGLLSFSTADLRRCDPADRVSWRYQAFYALRYLAHRELLAQPLPEHWQTWWNQVSRRLVREIADNKETHLQLGLERSVVVLEKATKWTGARQRDLEMLFARVAKEAEKYEQDFLVLWGFCAALDWLSRYWDLPWIKFWELRRGMCLKRLEWYGRYRDLQHLDESLTKQKPSRDRAAFGLQLILKVVMY